jgi:hypothetical protein
MIGRVVQQTVFGLNQAQIVDKVSAFMMNGEQQNMRDHARCNSLAPASAIARGCVQR